MYLLDTNIVSDIVRNPQGAVARKIAEVGEAHIATSIIVAAELRFGAIRKGSERLTTQLDAVLRLLPVHALDGDVDMRYGLLRSGLEQRGTPIGGNDMLIAAHALSLGAILVTDNTAEFVRVPGLPIENWLRA
jgi:tRNA(fMet)-specific endonuclease VapC